MQASVLKMMLDALVVLLYFASLLRFFHSVWYWVHLIQLIRRPIGNDRGCHRKCIRTSCSNGVLSWNEGAGREVLLARRARCLRDASWLLPYLPEKPRLPLHGIAVFLYSAENGRIVSVCPAGLNAHSPETRSWSASRQPGAKIFNSHTDL